MAEEALCSLFPGEPFAQWELFLRDPKLVAGEVLSVGFGEVTDQHRQVFVVEFGSFSVKTQLCRYAWQMHGNTVWRHALPLALRRLEQFFSRLVAVAVHDPAAVRGEEREVLLKRRPPDMM